MKEAVGQRGQISGSFPLQHKGGVRLAVGPDFHAQIKV
jgi:hypothetical protein